MNRAAVVVVVMAFLAAGCVAPAEVEPPLPEGEAPLPSSLGQVVAADPGWRAGWAFLHRTQPESVVTAFDFKGFASGRIRGSDGGGTTCTLPPCDALLRVVNSTALHYLVMWSTADQRDWFAPVLVDRETLEATRATVACRTCLPTPASPVRTAMAHDAIRFPLVIGDRWSSSFASPAPSRFPATFTVESEVGSPTTLETAMGVVQVVPVHHRYSTDGVASRQTLVASDVKMVRDREQPDARSVGIEAEAQGGSTVWYAPVLHSIVRVESRLDAWANHTLASGEKEWTLQRSLHATWSMELAEASFDESPELPAGPAVADASMPGYVLQVSPQRANIANATVIRAWGNLTSVHQDQVDLTLAAAGTYPPKVLARGTGFLEYQPTGAGLYLVSAIATRGERTEHPQAVQVPVDQLSSEEVACPTSTPIAPAPCGNIVAHGTALHALTIRVTPQADALLANGTLRVTSPTGTQYMVTVREGAATFFSLAPAPGEWKATFQPRAALDLKVQYDVEAIARPLQR